MKKIINFVKDKLTCEIFIIISLALIIFGSVVPFQSVGNGENRIEYLFIESRYKVVAIIAIVILLVSLLLALFNQEGILRWYLFFGAFFVAVVCFLLFVEAMRHHYAEGKTRYEIGTFLYSIGTIIITLLGMYSLGKGVKTNKKNK